MPRTKSLQHYPDRYQQILRECGLEGKRISIPCESGKQAASLRGHFYAFMGSLKATAAANPDNLDFQELWGLAATVMITIEERSGQVWLIYQSRELSWQAQALKRAIVTQGDARPTATGIDSSAARLFELSKAAAGRYPCPVCGELFAREELTTHQPCYGIAEREGGV